MKKNSVKNNKPHVRAIDMKSTSQIGETFDVLKQLRPHLVEKAYAPMIKEMAAKGYQLVAVRQAGRVSCVAGYRISRSLAWGKFLYVDDLVTEPAIRSKGHGKLLLDWLIGEAKRLHCDQLHLDSGIQRHDAHRFYLRERLNISSFHFSLKLT